MPNSSSHDDFHHRTSTVIEAERRAAQSSKLTPKVPVEMPSRQVPAKIKSKNRKIVAADRTVEIALNFSTIFFGFTVTICTAAFCVSFFFLRFSKYFRRF